MFYKVPLILCLLFVMSNPVLALERFHLVKISNSDKTDEYRVFTVDEYKEFDKSSKLENKYFSRALSSARSEWNKDKSKTAPFPSLSAKKYRIQKTYDDRAEADAKVADYVKRAVDSDAIAAARLKEKISKKYKGAGQSSAAQKQRLKNKMADALNQPAMDMANRSQASMLVMNKVNKMISDAEAKAAESAK